MFEVKCEGCGRVYGSDLEVDRCPCGVEGEYELVIVGQDSDGELVYEYQRMPEPDLVVFLG